MLRLLALGAVLLGAAAYSPSPSGFPVFVLGAAAGWLYRPRLRA